MAYRDYNKRLWSREEKAWKELRSRKRVQGFWSERFAYVFEGPNPIQIEVPLKIAEVIEETIAA